ncbi:hypothetical protein GOE05_23860 [Sinorhizobium medicae]|nr:hypothetical protein [Sinorhizobium medicae]
MNPALIVQRLVRAGLAVRTIERKAGFPRSKLTRLIEGTGSLTAEERERLEIFAAGLMPKGATSAPHHERCPPRYGR